MVNTVITNTLKLCCLTLDDSDITHYLLVVRMSVMHKLIFIRHSYLYKVLFLKGDASYEWICIYVFVFNEFYAH